MSSRDDAIFEKFETGLAVILSGLRELRAGGDWIDQDTAPVGPDCFLRAIRRGDLVAHKVPNSRKLLVRRADFDAWVMSHRVVRRAPAGEDTDNRDKSAMVAEAMNFRAPRRRKP